MRTVLSRNLLQKGKKGAVVRGGIRVHRIQGNSVRFLCGFFCDREELDHVSMLMGGSWGSWMGRGSR